MSQQYNSMFKICATCQYWSGSRDLMQYGDYIELDSPMQTGKCYNRYSGWFNGSPVQANCECRCWEKWSALR